MYIVFSFWLEEEKKGKNCINYVFSFLAPGVLWMRINTDQVIFLCFLCKSLSLCCSAKFIEIIHMANIWVTRVKHLAFLALWNLQKMYHLYKHYWKIMKSQVPFSRVSRNQIETLNTRIRAVGTYCFDLLDSSYSENCHSPHPHVLLCLLQEWITEQTSANSNPFPGDN